MSNSRLFLSLTFIILCFAGCSSSNAPSGGSTVGSFEYVGGPSNADVGAIIVTSHGTVLGTFITTVQAERGIFRYNTTTHDRSIVKIPQPDNIYSLAETKNGTILGLGYSTLYRSVDDGATWTASGPGRAGRIEIAQNGDIWIFEYAQQSQGDSIRYSTDDGRTWIPMVTTDPNATTNSGILPLADGSLLSCNGHIQYHSTDHGSTWTKVGQFNVSLATPRSPAGRLYLFPSDGGQTGGMYTDDGVTFSPITLPAVTNAKILAIDESGVLYLSSDQGGALYRSSDNGTTWQSVGNMPYYQRAFAVKGGVIYSATGGFGVVNSGDKGNSWTQIGPNDGLVDNISVNSSGRILARTDHNFVSQSADALNWDVINFPSASGLYAAAASPFSNTIVVGSADSIFTSVNGGQTWTKAVTTKSGAYRAITFSQSGTIFAGSDGKLMTSTDNGITWTQIGTDLGLGLGYDVGSIAVTRSGTIFVAPQSYADDYMMTSTDGGASFHRISLGSSPAILSMAVNSKGVLYITTAGLTNGLWRSTDGGKTWAQVDAGDSKADSGFWSVGFDANDILYIGTGTGILRSRSPM